MGVKDKQRTPQSWLQIMSFASQKDAWHVPDNKLVGQFCNIVTSTPT